MKLIDRVELIEKLIENAINFIETHSQGKDKLYTYLHEGFIGYSNYEDDDLIAEANFRDIHLTPEEEYNKQFNNELDKQVIEDLAKIAESKNNQINT